MNKIPNRQAMCDVLIKKGRTDRDITVLCSDSRGSASMTDYVKELPEQFVEVGIAEQSLVSVSAGLAKCGKRPFAASPACFLSTRSMEQVKVDVAYSKTNVKLIGISGGVSYGALGMTHHSAQDIATMASIPGLRVYIPSDRFQTEKLTEVLAEDNEPAYIRVGRNPVEDIYDESINFTMNKAIVHGESGEVVIVACGEMVKPALEAKKLLDEKGISATVVDMYCIKPIDKDSVISAAKNAKVVISVEEHSILCGMGSMVSQIVGENCPKKVINLGLPDAPVVTGNSKEVFDHYGLNAEGIANKAIEVLSDE